MILSAAAQAQIEGREVRSSLLVEAHFVSKTMRFWTGNGPLRTLDGREWASDGGLISMSNVEQASDVQSPAIEIALAGVQGDFVTLAHAEQAEYYNRPLIRYLQFFDEDWQCLDSPYALDMGRMQQLTSTMQQGKDGGTVHQVTVTAESPFATRRRPRYGFWTDRDQKQRFPGDRGLEDVAGIDKRVLTWPDF